MVEERPSSTNSTFTYNSQQAANPESDQISDPPFYGKKGALQPPSNVPKKDNPDQNAPNPDPTQSPPPLPPLHPETPAPAEGAPEPEGTVAGSPEGAHPDAAGEPNDDVSDGKDAAPPPAGTPLPWPMSTTITTSTTSVAGSTTFTLSAATAPAPMALRGYAMNTAVPGNGISFRHDAVAALADHPPIHLNVTHDRHIKNIAGSASMTAAARFNAPVDARRLNEAGKAKVALGDHGVHMLTDSDFEAYTTKENCALLGFSAQVDPAAPGYQDAATAISYLRSVGKTPNVSVNIKGTKLSYDAATDRTYMEGPYSLVHLALVDKGAFSDDVGVGVHDVEGALGPVPFTTAQLARDSEMLKAFQDPTLEFVECSLAIAGYDAMVSVYLADESVPLHARARLDKLKGGARGKLPDSAFACPETRKLPIHDAAHVRNALARFKSTDFKGCDKSSALARIHAAAKKFGVSAKNEFTLAHYEDGTPCILEAADDGHYAHEIPEEPSGSEPSYTEAGALPTTNSAQTVTGAENATDTSARTGTTGAHTMPNAPPTKVVVAPSADFEARVAALESREKAAIEAHLASLRGQIAADFGLAAETLSVYQTAEQLEAFRTALAGAKGNPLPRTAPTDPRAAQKGAEAPKRPHELFASDNFDTADWTAYREGARKAILAGKPLGAAMQGGA